MWSGRGVVGRRRRTLTQPFFWLTKRLRVWLRSNWVGLHSVDRDVATLGPAAPILTAGGQPKKPLVQYQVSLANASRTTPRLEFSLSLRAPSASSWR